MVDSELLKILCCPETHQALSVAGPAVLDEINRQVAAGRLKNRAGQPVTEKLESGLLRADGKVLYPISKGIPVMLIEEAIPLGA
jgi:uncharacterized protein YbaR (Trm112 family)